MVRLDRPRALCRGARGARRRRSRRLDAAHAAVGMDGGAGSVRVVEVARSGRRGLRGLASGRVVARRLCRVHGAVLPRRVRARSQRAPLRSRLHGAVRAHLARVDRGQRAAPHDGRRGRRRPQPLSRRGLELGLAARRRRALSHRIVDRARDRQLCEDLCRVARGGREARVVHQDRHCLSRREPRCADDPGGGLRDRSDSDGRRRDIRRVHVLLADRVLRSRAASSSSSAMPRPCSRPASRSAACRPRSRPAGRSVRDP